MSRLIATFDWEYRQRKRREVTLDNMYRVRIGTFSLPWNLELDMARSARRASRHLAWAEQPHTIDEVGSTFTIQGFDLNVSGVILGPSVTYRDGRIQFDPTKSHSGQAKKRRTFGDGSKRSVAVELLRNELNVLMTRGVRGMYIYAVDPELRRALLAAQERRLAYV